MTIVRRATALWNGTGKEGKGAISTQSKHLQDAPYAFNTRFEDKPGTNPEELIAAAHAGCFAMKLAFVIQSKGLEAQSLEVKAKVSLDDGAVQESKLVLKAHVEGIDDAAFAEMVKEAELNCPISKLLNCKIVVEFILNK